MGKDVLIQSVESGRSKEESMGLSQTGITWDDRQLTDVSIWLESDAPASIASRRPRDCARGLIALSSMEVGLDREVGKKAKAGWFDLRRLDMFLNCTWFSHAARKLKSWLEQMRVRLSWVRAFAHTIGCKTQINDALIVLSLSLCSF